MLNYILKRMAAGDVKSLSDLARELNVSEELVRQMIDALERMGYLRRISDGCNDSCSHCPSSEGCTLHQFGQAWAPTEKKLPTSQG
jgi:DeoR/GlpR family transcriptional regulator of sugar metabolism